MYGNYPYEFDELLEKVAAEAGDPTEMYNRHARNAGRAMAVNAAAGVLSPFTPIAGPVGTVSNLAEIVENWKAYNAMQQGAEIDYNDPKQYHRAKRVNARQHGVYGGLAALPLAGGAAAAYFADKKNLAAGLAIPATAASLYGAFNGFKGFYHGAREALAD